MKDSVRVLPGTYSLRYNPTTTEVSAWDTTVAAGGSSLTSTYVGVGNGSNLLSGSNQLIFNAGNELLIGNTGDLGSYKFQTPNARIGTNSGSGSTSPNALTFDPDYSTNAGAYPKIRMYNDDTIGFGLSSGQLDYGVRYNQEHSFYVGPNKKILFSATYTQTNNPIYFEGTGNTYPSIRRSSANLQVKLADNSAFTDLEVLDEAYDATAWNGSLEVPTKNAIRDKIESLSIGGYTTFAQFVAETNWTTGYINGSGDYTELPLGSSGKVLTSNGASSAPTWETPSGGGLTVGTTTIASGTDTKVLFNNAGVLGEYTKNGSGSVAMTTGTTLTSPFITTEITPTSNDGATLGVGIRAFSDLYLADGANINFNNGNANIVHSSGILTVSTGDLRVTTAGTNATSVVTLDGTQTIANKTLTTPKIVSGGYISDVNGNELLKFVSTGSAVNEVSIENNSAGSPPVIRATGETNVNLAIVSKGTGSILFFGSADNPAQLKIYEDTDNGTNNGTLTVPSALAGDVTYTFPDASTKIPIASQILTFSGPSTARTITFPDAAITVARTDAAQTFTGTQTFSAVITTNNAITASGNAATVPVTSSLSTVTNNSAATLTITMTTASAVDGQITTVRILDFSAAAQTISWVNTENSSIAIPTTTNGSTTLPLTVKLRFNTATTKWRVESYN